MALNISVVARVAVDSSVYMEGEAVHQTCSYTAAI